MLQSQTTIYRQFIAASHDKPARPAIVDVFEIDPSIAARHEDIIAKVMHKTCGLHGKLPVGPNEMSGRHHHAEGNKAMVLADLRENGPSKTVDIARRIDMPRQRVANYCSNLRREGRLALKQVKPGFPATWGIVA